MLLSWSLERVAVPLGTLAGRFSPSVTLSPWSPSGCRGALRPGQGRAWGGQRAGASLVQPAKPGAGETLRAREQQKLSCEGGSKGGFGLCCVFCAPSSPSPRCCFCFV
uniref:Uncharacterized protein n=1 Tax=Aquila chrysaetos chrysaetos TaxID=223781 RepID=A0A663FFK1_AQUCH